jgi:hypothetical protein
MAADDPIMENKPKRVPKPQSGLGIVWRFKGNMGWRKGYIWTTLAKGRVLDIRDNQYAHSSELVSVDDIDWYIQ